MYIYIYISISLYLYTYKYIWRFLIVVCPTMQEDKEHVPDSLSVGRLGGRAVGRTTKSEWLLELKPKNQSAAIKQ